MEAKKERSINVQYEGKEAKMFRLVAALLDTSVKDLLLQATTSYLINLATSTDDQLLLSILKGAVDKGADAERC